MFQVCRVLEPLTVTLFKGQLYIKHSKSIPVLGSLILLFSLSRMFFTPSFAKLLSLLH